MYEGKFATNPTVRSGLRYLLVVARLRQQTLLAVIAGLFVVAFVAANWRAPEGESANFWSAMRDIGVVPLGVTIAYLGLAFSLHRYQRNSKRSMRESTLRMARHALDAVRGKERQLMLGLDARARGGGSGREEIALAPATEADRVIRSFWDWLGSTSSGKYRPDRILKEVRAFSDHAVASEHDIDPWTLGHRSKAKKAVEREASKSRIGEEFYRASARHLGMNGFVREMLVPYTQMSVGLQRGVCGFKTVYYSIAPQVIDVYGRWSPFIEHCRTLRNHSKAFSAVEWLAACLLHYKCRQVFWDCIRLGDGGPRRSLSPDAVSKRLREMDVRAIATLRRSAKDELWPRTRADLFEARYDSAMLEMLCDLTSTCRHSLARKTRPRQGWLSYARRHAGEPVMREVTSAFRQRDPHEHHRATVAEIIRVYQDPAARFDALNVIDPRGRGLEVDRILRDPSVVCRRDRFDSTGTASISAG